MSGSDQEALERLRQATADRRQRVAETEPEPRLIGTGVKQLAQRFTLPPARQESLEERQRKEDEARRIEEHRRRQNWEKIAAQLGPRYEDCRLDGFVMYGNDEEQKRQESSIRASKDYAKNMADRVAFGDGVVLFGPPGTGKDHILSALLHIACRKGFNVSWINGLDFFGQLRDRMSDDASEEALIRTLTEPDILAISDPLPPWGQLTSFQASILLRVIDRRYRRRRPIWVTVNVANSTEAGDRMGTAVVSRLKERALGVYCNWPSYRDRKST